ncbi:hypothetical protein O181_077951 [Austropuccinia psidii MF-1]|uniref:Uncharacterized protein n=1 Tax=Austropuccinia psidii MF-1 TaxID=1389203 RepID=A0A9Q3FJ21_9BASI|nr:hypothetical protein [Austropuccinia psidii MF-1]
MRDVWCEKRCHHFITGTPKLVVPFNQAQARSSWVGYWINFKIKQVIGRDDSCQPFGPSHREDIQQSTIVGESGGYKEARNKKRQCHTIKNRNNP